MKARLFGALAKLDPRLLLMLMFFAIGLVAYEGWYLALRKPFLAYQKVVAARATLGATLSGSADAPGEVPRLAAELLGLLDRLAGELRLPAADDEMVASLMTELERSAKTDGVVLIGIRPGARRRVLSFEEASFDHVVCSWVLCTVDGLRQTLAEVRRVLKPDPRRRGLPRS